MAKYTEAKKQVNQYLAIYGDKNRPAIVLDGPDCHTLQTFLKYGWDPKKVYIPNNSQKDYQYIKRVHTQTYLKSVKEFIQDGHIHDSSVVYLDYMCSFRGNNKCSPKMDVKVLFDNINMDNSLVAITCSVRHPVKLSNIFSNLQIIKAITHIQKVAKQNGKSAELVPEFATYKNKGTMYTLLFKIRKDNDNQKHKRNIYK